MQRTQSIQRYLSGIALVILLVIPIMAFAMPLTFTVKNTTNEALGTVTLHQISGSSYLNVTAPGTWVTEVSGNVSAVTVNGYTVSYPNQGSIILPSGHAGRVDWLSTSYVEILDLQMGS